MRGITLIELMVVIAVAAILASVGLPSLFSLVAQERVTKQTNELLAQLSLMRSESVMRQRDVVLCPLYAGECDRDIASAVAGRRLYVWGTGYVAAARGGGDTQIEHEGSLDTVIQLVEVADDMLLVSNRKKFSFDHRGHAVAGSIYVCSHDNPGKRIVISALGRVRVEPQAQDICQLLNF